MALAITSMLARRFAWTETAVGSITVGASVRTITATAGTYAMHAGPSIGTGQDFLVMLKAAIDAALTPDSRTVDFTISPTTGRITLTITGGNVAAVSFSSALDSLLGLISSGSAGASYTATLQPQQVFYSASRLASVWRMARVVAADVTAAGVAYGVDSGIVRDEREQIFAKIPRDPTVRAALGQYVSALHPDDVRLSTRGAHTGEWTLDDMLSQAVGATFALYEGNFQASLTDDAERYSLVAIDPQDAMAPRAELDVDGWEAWHRCTLRLIRSGTGTRA
jgi:hypothetical protein